MNPRHAPSERQNGTRLDDSRASVVPTGKLVLALGWFDHSPKRCSHSDIPLYILLVIIHTKYTWVRQNDSNVYA